LAKAKLRHIPPLSSSVPIVVATLFLLRHVPKESSTIVKQSARHGATRHRPLQIDKCGVSTEGTMTGPLSSGKSLGAGHVQPVSLIPLGHVRALCRSPLRVGYLCTLLAWVSIPSTFDSSASLRAWRSTFHPRLFPPPSSPNAPAMGGAERVRRPPTHARFEQGDMAQISDLKPIVSAPAPASDAGATTRRAHRTGGRRRSRAAFDLRPRL
jgi:hypothetical protein